MSNLEVAIRELVRGEVQSAVAKAVSSATAQPAYVSAAEYALTRSISISTVRNAIRRGQLPAIRIGAAVRVRADIEIGKPIIVRATRRPTSPAARAAEILKSRTKRAPAKVAA